MEMADSPYSRGANLGVPRVELFLGYSYVRALPTLAVGNRIMWLNGGSTSVAFNLNRYLGLVADFGAYTNSKVQYTGAYTSTVNVDNPNVAVLSYLFGPRLSFRQHDRFTPFVQALFGGARANQVILNGCTFSCTLLPTESAFAWTAGGGLDLRVRRHIAIRLIQAEYLMTGFSNYTTGAAGKQNDMRLSAGIVFRFGGNPPVIPQPAVTYSCFVNPAAVYPGATIAVSGAAIYLDPAKTAVYTWTASGGTLTGSSSTASIDTTDTAPGSYTLKGHVSESARPSENADCSATYVVKAFEPPTVSCTANPSMVLSGNSSAITAIGISPQNRPLTYSFSSTYGSLSGSGSTATLNTAGAPTGPIGVSCNVVDDKGQTASATTSVTIAAPVVAPRPTTSALCPVSFERDPRRPARVDNEAKACLDQIALNLQQASDANLVLVGNAAGSEKGAQKLAAERAINTKAYLVGERGINSVRVTVYTGSQDGKIVSTTLVPAGAAFDATGYTPAQ
jgi:outer membrane protein OmpA-like peptidoglycan-associated protein